MLGGRHGWKDFLWDFLEREKEGESRSRWIEGSEVWKDRRIEGVNRLAGAVEVEDWLVEAIGGVDVELEKHLGFEALDFQRAIVGSDLEAMFGGEKTRIVSSCFSPCWFGKMGERLDSAQAVLLGFESLVNHRDGAFDLQSHRIILMLVTLLQPQRRMLPSWWECHPYGLSAMTARPSGHIVEIVGTPCFV